MNLFQKTLPEYVHFLGASAVLQPERFKRQELDFAWRWDMGTLFCFLVGRRTPSAKYETLEQHQ